MEQSWTPIESDSSPTDGSVYPRPLLLVGNKRSGTTLLGKLLNSHPHVFVAHEVDILTALYQLDRGESFHDDYEWDAPRQLRRLVDTYTFSIPESVDRTARIRSLFFDCITTTRLGEHITPERSTNLVQNLRWIGDKKPVQYADPILRPFLRKYFPDAHMLHIVRHPRAVIGSMKQAAASWPPQFVPEFWRKPPEFVLRRWAIHEEWVISAMDEGWPVLTVRLEDLSKYPRETMERVFRFLNLDPSKVSEFGKVDPAVNDKYQHLELAFDDRALQVMSRYGYT